MLKEKLGLDDKDVKIVSKFIENPDVSQSELAEELKISQPSVNARIHKLKKKGILKHSIGIEFNKTDMSLARVDFTAANADEILETLSQCSFFVNGFILSGENNCSIMIVGHDLKKIESIVTRHLRSNPEIKDINMSVVVSSAKPYVCAIDLGKEQSEQCQYVDGCKVCKMKKRGK